MEFSLTSGTLFANRKLPLRAYLLAIAIFCNEVKGKSMLALSRDLGVQYKTSFVLAHKMREAMASEVRQTAIGGDGKRAEIDGGYFGGYVKPANRRENRRDDHQKRWAGLAPAFVAEEQEPGYVIPRPMVPVGPMPKPVGARVVVMICIQEPVGPAGRPGTEPSSSGRMTGAISLAVQGAADGHDQGTPVIRLTNSIATLTAAIPSTVFSRTGML
jgi:hypothetical protein